MPITSPATTTLRINGALQVVQVAPDTPLLWVLRDTLGLKGTKFGCGVGVCGACTVLADGVAIRSCLTPVSAVGSRHIRTIEDRQLPILDVLREAWRAEDVPQCGYCQPGQIAAAAGLLLQDDSPDDAAIDRAMRGIVCRCGTYSRIRNAIRRAAREPASTDAHAGSD